MFQSFISTMPLTFWCTLGILMLHLTLWTCDASRLFSVCWSLIGFLLKTHCFILHESRMYFEPLELLYHQLWLHDPLPPIQLTWNWWYNLFFLVQESSWTVNFPQWRTIQCHAAQKNPGIPGTMPSFQYSKNHHDLHPTKTSKGRFSWDFQH